MYTFIKISLFLLCLSYSINVYALIYDLVPAKNKNGIGGRLPTTQEVWHEEVTINGYKSPFKLEVSDDDTTDLLGELLNMDPQLKFTATGGNILAISDRGNYEKRYLLLRLSNTSLRFSINKLKNTKRPEWPNGLPKLSGVEVTNSFIYHKRGTEAVEFTTHQHPQHLFEGLCMELEGQNYHIISASLSQNNQSGSAIFSTQDAQFILLLGISKSSSDVKNTTGILLQSKCQ